MTSEAGGYVLTDDAVSDLDRIEVFVASYADDAFVERLEEDFFAAFEKLPGEALQHPVYQFTGKADEQQALHEYRSVNVYHYKVFYYLRESDGMVVIYRILHLVSDFTRADW